MTGTQVQKLERLIRDEPDGACQAYVRMKVLESRKHGSPQRPLTGRTDRIHVEVTIQCGSGAQSLLPGLLGTLETMLAGYAAEKLGDHAPRRAERVVRVQTHMHMQAQIRVAAA